MIAQQTREADPILSLCRAIVEDSGPALNQHWVNVSCLLDVW